MAPALLLHPKIVLLEYFVADSKSFDIYSRQVMSSTNGSTLQLPSHPYVLR